MSMTRLRIPPLHRMRSTRIPLTTMLGILVMAAPKWTMAQITPVCDRTPGVRDAIVKSVPGKNDCADVNEADLAGIEGVLRLVGPHEVTSQDPYQAPYMGGDLSEPMMELKAGDFSGLSSLEAITLRYNHLTSLPANVFSRLPSLQWLNLSHNALTTLPVGVFSGLTGLQELYLSDNSLSGLEREVFAGLSALRRLHLRYNALTNLAKGVFLGLSALTWLDLEFNRLTRLTDGLFSGLKSLYIVQLHGNPGPLPIVISLELVDEGRFRVRVHAGATFAIVLPATVNNGSIEEDRARAGDLQFVRSQPAPPQSSSPRAE